MPSAILSATLQATALASLSNLCGQLISAYRKDLPLLPSSLSLLELSRFLFLSLLTAPINYHWQAFLERTFPARTSADGAELSTEDLELAEKGYLSEKRAPWQPPPTPSNGAPKPRTRLSWRNTFLKWFTDCITVGALFNTILFLVIMGLMKGKDVEKIMATVRAETIPIIVASYKLWPFASVVNFTLVPVERRIVFLSAVGLVWGVYLSLVAQEV